MSDVVLDEASREEYWVSKRNRYSQLVKLRDEEVKKLINQIFGENKDLNPEQKENLKFLSSFIKGAYTKAGQNSIFGDVVFYETAFNPAVLNAQVKDGILQKDSLEHKIKYACYKCAVETKYVMQKDLNDYALRGDIKPGFTIADAKIDELMTFFCANLDSAFSSVLREVKENGIDGRTLEMLGYSRYGAQGRSEELAGVQKAVVEAGESIAKRNNPHSNDAVVSVVRLISRSPLTDEQLISTIKQIATNRRGLMLDAYKNSTSTEGYLQKMCFQELVSAINNGLEHGLTSPGYSLADALKETFANVEIQYKQVQLCKEPKNAEKAIQDWKADLAVNYVFSKEQETGVAILTTKDIMQRLDDGIAITETEFLHYALGMAAVYREGAINKLTDIANRVGLSDNAILAAQRVVSLSKDEAQLVGNKEALADLIDNSVFPYTQGLYCSREGVTFKQVLAGYLSQATMLDEKKEKLNSVLLNPDGTLISKENKAILDSALNFANELQQNIGIKYTKGEVGFLIDGLRDAYFTYEMSCRTEDEQLEYLYKNTDFGKGSVAFESLTGEKKAELLEKARNDKLIVPTTEEFRQSQLDYTLGYDEMARSEIATLERGEESKIIEESQKEDLGPKVYKYDLPTLNPDGSPISEENKDLLAKALDTIELLKELTNGKTIAHKDEATGVITYENIAAKMPEEDVKLYIRNLQNGYAAYERQCRTVDEQIKDAYGYQYPVEKEQYFTIDQLTGGEKYDLVEKASKDKGLETKYQAYAKEIEDINEEYHKQIKDIGDNNTLTGEEKEEQEQKAYEDRESKIEAARDAFILDVYGEKVPERESQGNLVKVTRTEMVSFEDLDDKRKEELRNKAELDGVIAEPNGEAMDQALELIRENIAIVESDLPEWQQGHDTDSSLYSREEIYRENPPRDTNASEVSGDNREEREETPEENTQPTQENNRTESASPKPAKKSRAVAGNRYNAQVGLHLSTAVLIGLSILFATMGAWIALALCVIGSLATFGADVRYTMQAQKQAQREQDAVSRAVQEAVQEVAQENNRINEEIHRENAETRANIREANERYANVKTLEEMSPEELQEVQKGIQQILDEPEKVKEENQVPNAEEIEKQQTEEEVAQVYSNMFVDDQYPEYIQEEPQVVASNEDPSPAPVEDAPENPTREEQTTEVEQSEKPVEEVQEEPAFVGEPVSGDAGPEKVDQDPVKVNEDQQIPEEVPEDDYTRVQEGDEGRGVTA